MSLRAVIAAALLLPTVAGAQTFIGFTGIPLFSTASLVPTTDVVGQASFAAADALLEADGLDGTEVEVCSAAPDNEVVSQDPLAGSMVSLGAIVTVRTSNGVECTWDTTGIPAGWYTIPTVLADNDFRREMRVEADGDGVWAYWLAGSIRGTANLQLNITVIRTEATSGGADWARWAPGTQPGNTGNLQLNMIEAFSADFQ